MIFIFQILDRAHSMGALNFGYVSDDGILRGSVTPFMHFTNNNESKQSLGMISHKKSVITIFGHKHKFKHFTKKIDSFINKISTALDFG